jgi:hypothetical protein
MSNKSKKATQVRKVAQVAKVVAKNVDVPVVRTTPDAIVHQAPIGTRTIVDVARELNLTPKNARRILRAMKANKSIPDYQEHVKGNRHYLTSAQIDAYKARVMSRRDAS